MRYLIYSLLVSIFIGTLFSCTDSKQNKEEEKITLMKADWSDTTALAKAIDIFYKDSVIKKGNVSLEIRDPFIRSSHPYQYLQLHKIYRPQFKLIAPTIGYMPVLMLAGRDSAIVDFQIMWQQPNPNDSVGEFIVTETFLQKIRNQLRYEWIQEGDYWIRRNVEVPPTTQQGKGKKSNIEIDPAMIKRK